MTRSPHARASLSAFFTPCGRPEPAGSGEVDPLQTFQRGPCVRQIPYSGRRGFPPATRVNRRRQRRRPCPRPVHLSADSGGGTDRRRTISVGRCLPTRSEDPRSESDKPGAPSSAAHSAIAGGCAEDPCCRSAGTARPPRLPPAAGHRLANSADLASPWRTPLHRWRRTQKPTAAQRHADPASFRCLRSQL